MNRYSDAQWLWIYYKFCEGHTLTEIAAFLGVHPKTVTYQFGRRGFRVPTGDLPPLEAYKSEFLSLYIPSQPGGSKKFTL